MNAIQIFDPLRLLVPACITCATIFLRNTISSPEKRAKSLPCAYVLWQVLVVLISGLLFLEMRAILAKAHGNNTLQLTSPYCWSWLVLNWLRYSWMRPHWIFISALERFCACWCGSVRNSSAENTRGYLSSFSFLLCYATQFRFCSLRMLLNPLNLQRTCFCIRKLRARSTSFRKHCRYRPTFMSIVRQRGRDFQKTGCTGVIMNIPS